MNSCFGQRLKAIAEVSLDEIKLKQVRKSKKIK